MIVTKIPKHYFPITCKNIGVKPFYIRLGIVPSTTRRVLSDSKLSSSIRQTKIFETVDVAIETHKNFS